MSGYTCKITGEHCEYIVGATVFPEPCESCPIFLSHQDVEEARAIQETTVVQGMTPAIDIWCPFCHGTHEPEKCPLEGLCLFCKTRPATVYFGDALGMTHGGFLNCCELCAAEQQLEHARKCAEHLPDLEAEVAHLREREGVSCSDIDELEAESPERGKHHGTPPAEEQGRHTLSEEQERDKRLQERAREAIRYELDAAAADGAEPKEDWPELQHGRDVLSLLRERDDLARRLKAAKTGRVTPLPKEES